MVCQAIKAINGYKCLWISYPRFIDDPQAEYARISRFLGIDPDPELANKFINGFLDRSLRRNVVEDGAIHESTILPDAVRAYHELECLSVSNGEEGDDGLQKVTQLWNNIRQDGRLINIMSPFLSRALSDRLSALVKCDVLEQRIQELDRDRAQLREDYERRLELEQEGFRKQIAGLQAQIAELEGDRAQLREDYERRLELEQEEFREQIAGLQAQIAELERDRAQLREDYERRLELEQEEFRKQIALLTEQLDQFRRSIFWKMFRRGKSDK
ncbi:hypothetical protein D6779_08145 [Candidatus Parcubacteria bacterium]|nr:MAG: hypothetical protein D6779_08145 [Candidatus Parcubacteria bacterium]